MGPEWGRGGLKCLLRDVCREPTVYGVYLLFGGTSKLQYGPRTILQHFPAQALRPYGSSEIRDACNYHGNMKMTSVWLKSSICTNLLDQSPPNNKTRHACRQQAKSNVKTVLIVTVI